MPTISGSPVVGSTLTASKGTWSGAPTSYKYVWRRCDGTGRNCVGISGATGATYVLQAIDAGHKLRVIVKAANAFGQTTARSAFTAIVSAGSAPDTTAPSAPTGLKASSSSSSQEQLTWTASTDNVGVVGYQTFLNGAAGKTSTSTSYSFTGLSCGTSYTFGVAAYDAAGNVSQTSSVSGKTSACGVAPSSSGAPTVSGSAQVDQTLSTTNGTWTGSAPMSYVYQWQDCDAAGANCATITGAAASTYTVASGDQGHTIRSRVKATNAYGSTWASSAQSGVVQAASGGGSSGLSGVRVSGNHLVDGNGNVVRLHGVNYSGTEYACIQGWGIFDGPSDAASVQAIASWHANIVHIGLNEDCILGINGVKAAYSGSNYMNAVTSYVNLLHANGLYAEVSLMWAAPGTKQALDHPQILDQDHSPAALQAIANAFKNDPNTIIGLQSEPHDITWACWRNGGTSCSVGYTALGMQGALNAIRGTGATNVVTASGISYANDLSQWLANEPADSLGQVMAETHVYGGNACASAACFNTNDAPVAAQVPVIFGETGETYDDSSCGSTNTASFMSWADAHGVGYEAWAWDTWGSCGSLISDFNGTPANAYARYVHDHYVATFPSGS